MIPLLLLHQVAASLRFPLHRSTIVYDPLHDIHQVEYLTRMYFGSQRFEMELIIDTGSSDLWVPDAFSHGFDKRVRKYNCKQSQTCRKTHQELGITYDDGPIKGVIAWDEVWLRDIKFNQSFLLIYSAEAAMSNAGGILGLGFRNLAVNPNPTILESLIDQKLIASKLFSIYLNDVGSEGSYIIFGGIDEKYIRKNETMIYTPILNHYQYLISSRGLEFGGALFEISQSLVDSGTSCITVPARVIDGMLPKLEELGLQCSYRVESYSPAYCMMNCLVNAVSEQDIKKAFPKLYLVLDDYHKLELNPEEYIYSCHILNESQSKCYTKLERSQQDDILILGDAFLQSYYAVFDQDQMRIGFAHSINEGGMKIRVQGQAFSVLGALLQLVFIVFVNL